MLRLRFGGVDRDGSFFCKELEAENSYYKKFPTFFKFCQLEDAWLIYVTLRRVGSAEGTRDGS